MIHEGLTKEELAEKIIHKWLKLQKTIKEEITLEDVIINQQKKWNCLNSSTFCMQLEFLIRYEFRCAASLAFSTRPTNMRMQKTIW